MSEVKLLPAVASGAPLLDVVHCCDAMILLKALASSTVDVVITSPPYNMGTNMNGAKPSSPHNNNWGNSKLLSLGYDGWTDDMPEDEYQVWQRQILDECLRIIKPSGAIFYNHKWRIQGGLLHHRLNMFDGLPLRQIIVWDRGGSNNHNKAFFAPQYEVIYVIAKSDFYIRQDATAFGDVWRISPEYNNDHPAPFPIALPERILVATDAQIVVDPFGGSGSTALAAKRLGRHFITCDISGEYCDLMRRRLAQPYTPSFMSLLDTPA